MVCVWMVKKQKKNCLFRKSHSLRWWMKCHQQSYQKVLKAGQKGLSGMRFLVGTLTESRHPLKTDNDRGTVACEEGLRVLACRIVLVPVARVRERANAVQALRVTGVMYFHLAWWLNVRELPCQCAVLVGPRASWFARGSPMEIAEGLPTGVPPNSGGSNPISLTEFTATCHTRRVEDRL